MRILLISVWKPRRGGIVTHVENLIRNSRNSFEILTYGNVNLPFFRALTFVLFGFLRGAGKDFDVIHAHYALPQGFLGVLLKKLRKKPLVTTIHGSDVAVLAKSAPGRFLVKFVLQNSDRVIAVSKFLKDEAVKLGIGEDRVSIIYGGVPVSEKQKKEFSTAFLGKRQIITFAGGLVWQKGVDVLLRAYELVNEQRSGTALVIVGSGKQQASLERLDSELGTNAHFVGSVESLCPVLEKSAVLVLPSREEGFGIVLLEAMDAGVPVVASRVGGIPEIIEHGYNGMLVERENHVELAGAILKVLNDSKLRSSLIRNAKSSIKAFRWEKTAGEIDAVYEEVKRMG